MQVFNQQHKEKVDSLITELRNDFRNYESDQGLSAVEFAKKYDNSYSDSNPFISEQFNSYKFLMNDFKDAFLKKENDEYLKFQGYLNTLTKYKDNKDKMHLADLFTEIEGNINKNSIANSRVDISVHGELLDYYFYKSEYFEQKKVAELCETLFRHRDDERSLVEVLTDNGNLKCHISPIKPVEESEDVEKFILNFTLPDSDKSISIPLQLYTIEKNALAEDLSPYSEKVEEEYLLHKASNYRDSISIDSSYSHGH